MMDDLKTSSKIYMRSETVILCTLIFHSLLVSILLVRYDQIKWLLKAI